MLKYLTKISMDIFPSVLATIIGAYIVNHYINARPAPDTPAAAVAPAQTKKEAKPAEVANLPAPGVKAKGVSEKGVSEKGISEKSVTDKPTAEKPADKAADQPAENKPAENETAAAPATPRGRPTASRDSKTMAKATPAPTISAPVVTAPAAETSAAPASNSATPDANDLARAAIERLRKSPDSAPQETAHAGEAPRVQEAPRLVTAAPPSVRPLPPPITVSTPGPEAYGSPTTANPPYTASVGSDDANRLTPPADIPVPVVIAPPLDLRADAAGPTPKAKTNVADEMLSGVKSMFHAVLPKSVTPD
ncbi:hypothetical protein NLM33_25350 [Bradyrhizobium sp. CCGUVB1N3]|uniref:hypothetical protein n=1 Tax=Bradyrhizobium sp. CCGUVB1N3 TaxID=2949629 RepID=UPI0020B313F0|nr:hypothetical protein [Bradyrhizobium sp. CCGUVB1N3]MCP3473644.1 hypothetical protein [Bradyrhizobium sp. CCGUVB1N3]